MKLEVRCTIIINSKKKETVINIFEKFKSNFLNFPINDLEVKRYWKQPEKFSVNLSFELGNSEFLEHLNGSFLKVLSAIASKWTIIISSGFSLSCVSETVGMNGIDWINFETSFAAESGKADSA